MVATASIYSNLKNLKQLNVIFRIIIVILVMCVTKVMNDDPIVHSKYRPYNVNGNNNDDPDSGDAAKHETFQEYFIEHNVSEGDAIRAFNKIGVKYLEGELDFVLFCECNCYVTVFKLLHGQCVCLSLIEFIPSRLLETMPMFVCAMTGFNSKQLLSIKDSFFIQKILLN